MATISNFDLDSMGSGLNEIISYTEGESSILLAPNAAVAATGNFDGQTLTISGLLEEDEIAFAAGIIVVGNQLLIGGTTIGTFAGGTGGANLVVSFNANASASEAQTLLANLTYRNISESPPGNDATVAHTLNVNLAGTTRTDKVTVHWVNEAPVVDLNGANAGTSVSLSYTENDAPILIAPSGLATDSDSLTFGGGFLKVSYDAGQTNTDQLLILANSIVTIAGNVVSVDGVAIGTFTGGGNGAALKVNFNAQATQARVDTLIQHIAYASSSENPSANPRTVRFTIDDGDGTANGGDNQHFTFATIGVTPVGDIPSVDLNGAAAGTSTSIVYGASDPLTQIAPAATVADLDSANFIGGSLTISFTANGTATDRLAILTDATVTLAGSAGTTVKVDGFTVGTLSGGNGGSDLVITFTTNSATPARVQTLLQHIGYANTSGTPSTLERTVTFTIDDGDGESNAATATVSVNVPNDTPTLAAEAAGTLTDTAALDDFGSILGQLDGADADPGAVLTYGIDGDADGILAGAFGTLTVNLDGTYTYVPDDAAINALVSGGNTSDTFTVKVTDEHGAVATAVLTVIVNAANDTPTLAAEAAGALTDTAAFDDFGALPGQIEGADVDAGAALTYALAVGEDGLGGYGTLNVNGDGSYSYTPDDAAINALAQGVSVSDTFEVQVTDEHDASTVAMLTVDITGANDAPTTTLVTLEAMDEDSGARLITQAELLANASDIDCPSLTATDLAIASGLGTLVDNLNGTWSYTPPPDDDSSVSFSYTVTDGSLTAAGSASLDITPVNDAPVANTVNPSGAEDALSITVTLSGSDVDGTIASYTLASLPTNGTLYTNAGLTTLAATATPYASATFYFVPAANFNGDTAFTYTVTDNEGASDATAATATITVTAVIEAPVLDLDANNSAAAGTAYATTFTRNGAPVAVADSDVSIADADDTNIELATIALTDALTGDSLAVSNMTALATLGISVGSSSATQITLTGSASTANYQAALQLITFTNSSAFPGNADRHVTVVVSDGDASSNTATATIHVSNNIDLTTLSGMQGFIVQGDAAGDFAGFSVSSAGDVNGDGFDDLIIGAYAGDDGGSSAGEAYVVFGKSGGFGTAVGGRQVIDLTTLSAAQGFIIQGDDVSDRAGFSVSSAGDVNGDGFDDLIVGALSGDGGGYGAGESYVVFGKSGGFGTAVGGRQVIDLTTLSAADGFIVQGDAAGDYAGWSVSSAGDVNGDGFDDLIVGAYTGDDGGFRAGEAYVVFGKSGGFGTAVGGRQVIDLTTLIAADGFIVQGDASADYAGWSVSSAGDVNGDGFDDLIVGAPGGDDGGSSAGEAYVVFGKSGGFGTAVGGRQVIDLTTLIAADGFIVQGDAAVDLAGGSVSSAGDVNGDGFDDLIVGARGGDDGGSYAGEAYVVFGKSGGFGTAVGGRQVIDLTTLIAADGFIVQGDVASDQAGWSVSSAGDVNGDGFDDLIVGARGGDDGGSYAGEAYVVFGKSGGFGTAVGGRQVIDLTTLIAADGFIVQGDAAGDRAGWSVSSAGDVNGDGFDDLIVGAPLGYDGGGSAGEAYVIFGGDFLGGVVFAGTSGANTLTGTAAAETFVGGQGDDTLNGGGGADAFQGGEGNDTIVVGSTTPLDLNGGSGIDTVNLDALGGAIDLSGLNSSRFTDIEKIDLAGTQENTLVLDKQSALDMAGSNGNAFDDNTLLIKGDAGDRVSLLDGWISGATVINPFGETGSYVTYTNGTARLLVESEVQVYRGRIDLTTLSAAQGFIVQGDAAVDLAGGSVSSAGDVNGDGFDDLIVGAYAGDDGGVDAGEAYVVFGKSGGFGTAVGGRQVIDLTTLSVAQGFIIQGDDVSDQAGFSVSSAGDVNGDGFDDLIVGALFGDDGGSNAGEAYVVFGKSGGFGTAVGGRQVIDLTALSAVDGFIVQGDAAGDQAGRSVSSAGDVNGDGFDDLIVGAPFGYDGGGSAGEAYVVFGKSGGFGTAVGGRQVIDLTTLSAADGFIVQGDAAYDQAGFSVSSAGDVNGDGFDDLIVGARNGDDGGSLAGEAYVVFGKSGGFGTAVGGRQVIDLTTLIAADGFIVQGDAAGDYAGWSVSSAGDVNGDGFDDLIVGARGGDDGGVLAGEAYVVFGKSGGFGTAVGGRQVIDLTALSAVDGFIVQGDAAGDQAGLSVSSAGDVNGDGFDDLIVGAPRGDDGGSYAGEAYVVFGKSGGFGTAVGGRQVIDLTTLIAADGFIVQGDAADDLAGRSVSSAGDVNGDGFDDLIVGAPGGDDGGSSAGEAYVVFGGHFLGGVMFAGTSGNDTLSGTAAAETFVGGQGDDTLNGGGGADAFQGGEGDDTITVANFSFAKVDGGTGNDKLVLLGAGAFFDFSALADNKTQSIEAIDFTGTGNNILTLGLTDVLNLPDGRNIDFTGVTSVPKSLVIDGNAGDTVNIEGDSRGTWTLTASDVNLNGSAGGTYDFWVFDAGAQDFAALAVKSAVDVFVV